MRETRTNQKDSKMHYTMEDKLVALLNNRVAEFPFFKPAHFLYWSIKYTDAFIDLQ